MDNAKKATRNTEPTSRIVMKNLDFDPDIPDQLVYLTDDMSISNKLNIKNRTLWRLVVQNRLVKPSSNEDDEGRSPQVLWDKITIPKNGGGTRVLHEPLEPLKGVQKVLLASFVHEFNSRDHFGAYVPGRNVFDMAKRHVGYGVKLSLDIKDFFHWCHRHEVQSWLEDVGYPDPVVEIMSTLFTVPLNKPKKDKPVYVLAQGAPTSGAVSNYVANRRIDQPIMNIIDDMYNCEWVYSRYSDNIEISLDRNWIEKSRVMRRIRRQLNKNDFWINDKKTQIQRKDDPDNAMRVLGINVGEKLNIPGDEYKRLRAMVHNCYTNGFEDEYEKAGRSGPGDMYTFLKSKLEYWAMAREDKIKPLRKKLEKAKKKHLIK